MNKLIFLLIKKELYNFFHSLFFYTSIFINLIFCLIIIKSSSSLSYIPLFSIIIIPLLTMHLWSEEKDLQDTLPVTDSLLILSKLFSSLITYLIIIIPIFIISFINNNELIIIFTSLFLIIFYASSAISLCLFLNLFTTNKALSFFISFLILLCTTIINKVSLLLNLNFYIQKIFNYFSFSWRFDAASKGIIDTRDLIYFLLITIINIILCLVFKNKFRNGRKTYLYLPIITCILLLVCTSSLYIRKDCTKNQIYSLTKETKNLLNNFHEPIHVTWYTTKNISLVTPAINEIQELLMQFSENKNIILKKVIIDKNNSARNLLKSYNVEPVSFENFSEIVSAILVEYQDKTEIIPLVLNSENLEFIISSIFKKFSDNKFITCQILSGSKLNIQHDYPYLEAALSSYGINCLTVENVTKLYDDIPLLLFGCSELTEMDCNILDSFILNGNNIMFAVSPFDVLLDQNWKLILNYNQIFFHLLSQYGITINPSLIYDSINCINISLSTNQNHQSKHNIYYPLWINTRPLELYNDDINIFWAADINCNNNYSVILKSSDNSFLINIQSQELNASPFEIEKIIPDEKSKNSYNIAIKKIINNNSKLIVCSDYLICSKVLDYTSNLNNLEFIINCVLDLNNCDDLLKIRNKRRSYEK